RRADRGQAPLGAGRTSELGARPRRRLPQRASAVRLGALVSVPRPRSIGEAEGCFECLGVSETKRGPHRSSLRTRLQSALEVAGEAVSSRPRPRLRPGPSRQEQLGLKESDAFEPPFARFARLLLGRLGRRLKGLPRSDTPQRREKRPVICCSGSEV